MKMHKLTAVLGLAVTMGFVGSASAALITGVTIEDFSSELNNTSLAAANTINKSGLGADAGGEWYTNASHANDNNWLTAGGDTAPWQITFDLGANYDLTDLHVWNYRESGLGDDHLRGIKDLTILVADSEGGAFTSVGSYTFAAAPESNFVSNPGESHTLTVGNVRLVRFDIANSHGGSTQYAGFGEVEFNGVVVPEPGSLTLLLVAIAGGALVLRRRR